MHETAKLPGATGAASRHREVPLFHRIALRRARAGALCALFLLTGCGAAPEMAVSAPADYAGPAPAGPMPQAAAMPAQAGAAQADLGAAPGRPAPASPGNSVPSPAPASAKSQTAEVKSTAPKPLIAYNGELGMTVDGDAVASTLDGVVAVAESYGGHLAGRSNDSVKIKVPSDSFREAFSKVEKLGEVTARSVRAEDVTAEFRDLEVRLENLRATRKRLEEFLSRAGTLTDMLTLERELERVSTEMDVIAGRLRVMREMTSMSELSVRLAARPKPTAVVVTPPPPPPPAPPPRTIDLPVPWLGTLGIDNLLRMETPS
jgi:hypothetical protein